MLLGSSLLCTLTARPGLLQDALEQLVAMFNKAAMATLAEEDWKRCAHLLDQAAALTARKGRHILHQTSRLRLEAVTHNNRACYFRRRGKPRSALKMLMAAYEVTSLPLRCLAHSMSVARRSRAVAACCGGRRASRNSRSTRAHSIYCGGPHLGLTLLPAAAAHRSSRSSARNWWRTRPRPCSTSARSVKHAAIPPMRGSRP